VQEACLTAKPLISLSTAGFSAWPLLASQQGSLFNPAQPVRIGSRKGAVIRAAGFPTRAEFIIAHVFSFFSSGSAPATDRYSREP
jgi:hypothetical protein